MTQAPEAPVFTAKESFIHNTLHKPGLEMKRLFTTEGVHPYDEVTWERRDVVQNNWKTGEVVFEQRGVELMAPQPSGRHAP